MKTFNLLSHTVLVSTTVLNFGSASIAEPLNVSQSGIHQPAVSIARRSLQPSRASVQEQARQQFQWGIGNYLVDRNQDAIAAFTKAIELDSTHADAYLHRGISFQAIGQLELALNDYEQALELDSNHAFAHYNKGRLLQQMKKYTAANDALSQAVQLYAAQGKDADRLMAVKALNQVRIVSQAGS